MKSKLVLVPFCVTVLLLPAIAAGANQGSDPVQQPPRQIWFVDPQLSLPGQLSNITVLFNPKEISLDKSVPWEHHRNTDSDEPSLEFTQGKPHSLNLTLMFDGYESRTDVGAMLAQFSKFVVDHSMKRPPMVKFLWGNNGPAFQGVVDSMSVKYTLFLEDGTPCRATVNLHMTEAEPARAQDDGHNGNETSTH